MNISILHKMIATVMAISLTPQGVLATVTPEVLQPVTEYHQEWLSIENMEERQFYDIDRAELCKYLINSYTELTGKQAPELDNIRNPYDDVSAEEFPYVVQASALGITDSKTTEFNPSQTVTKGEFALMLHNMVRKAYPRAVVNDKTVISFDEEIQPQYKKALSFAFSRGLMVKQGNGKMAADSKVNLGELASVLNRTVAAAPYYAVVNNSLTEKRAYLTFDDGVSENTVKILDTLKKYDVKATFFVTGKSNPEILRRIRNEGHTIGNHTMSHKYQDIYASSENFWKDFDEERDYLLEVLGDTSMYMRFPGGSNNAIGVRKKTLGNIQAQAKKKGYIYVDWNVDSGDATANTLPKDEIVNNVLTGAKNKTDAVILMHQTKPKTTTAAALPEIIEGLQEMGFELASLTKSAYYPRFMK